jgi:hypothetical protein
MDNTPAFPIVVDYGDGVKYQTGMNLRDYFAAKAMQGICASDPSTAMTNVRIAAEAYDLADAMMKARSE